MVLPLVPQQKPCVLASHRKRRAALLSSFPRHGEKKSRKYNVRQPSDTKSGPGDGCGNLRRGEVFLKIPSI